MNIYRRLIAGCDEAGRGALAGPIVAAAVTIELGMEHFLAGAKVRDSKKVSEEKRPWLAEFIAANAIAVGYGVIWIEEIEQYGIGWANDRAMWLAVNELLQGDRPRPALVIVDGHNEIQKLPIPQEAFAKADNTELVVAASSIMAKVHHDNLMQPYALKYPEYKFENNKGYGTPAHCTAIAELGITPIHRPSFCKKRSVQYNPKYIRAFLPNK